jgi:2,3-bisphosphoglycerate-independent phosphoglycerate mutase
MPDHHTPTERRVHSAEPVPYVLQDSATWKPPAAEPVTGFSEKRASEGQLVEDAAKMIEMLLKKN